jgi:hypothetical protein
MNESGKSHCGSKDDVIQDGVTCPAIAPWGRYAGILTGIPMILIAVLAVYILGKTSFTALVVWLLLLFVFAVPLRYLICARCPYYGQPCSTMVGVLIPRMFKKKQEGKSMVIGLWLDVAFFLLLFFIPLPYAWRGFGWPGALIWVNAIIFGFSIHTRFGCARCPFTFCPINKAARMVWIVRQEGASRRCISR